MKKTIELSKLNPELEIDEIVNYLLDNGYDSIVDDTMKEVECVYLQMHPCVYLYEEMYDIWDTLKIKIL
jgi:hypothetical protein